MAIKFQSIFISRGKSTIRHPPVPDRRSLHATSSNQTGNLACPLAEPNRLTKMASSSSSPFIRLVDEEYQENDMTLLSTPSKVAFSSAQNPLRSITHGYRETDIQLLSMEAGKPRLNRSMSADSEREVSTFPDLVERKRELYRQIAVSYSAFTLYLPLGTGLSVAG
jgi:hypothetical protein